MREFNDWGIWKYLKNLTIDLPLKICLGCGATNGDMVIKQLSLLMLRCFLKIILKNLVKCTMPPLKLSVIQVMRVIKTD